MSRQHSIPFNELVLGGPVPSTSSTPPSPALLGTHTTSFTTTNTSRNLSSSRCTPSPRVGVCSSSSSHIVTTLPRGPSNPASTPDSHILDDFDPDDEDEIVGSSRLPGRIGYTRTRIGSASSNRSARLSVLPEGNLNPLLSRCGGVRPDHTHTTASSSSSTPPLPSSLNPLSLHFHSHNNNNNFATHPAAHRPSRVSVRSARSSASSGTSTSGCSAVGGVMSSSSVPLHRNSTTSATTEPLPHSDSGVCNNAMDLAGMRTRTLDAELLEQLEEVTTERLFNKSRHRNSREVIGDGGRSGGGNGKDKGRASSLSPKTLPVPIAALLRDDLPSRHPLESWYAETDTPKHTTASSATTSKSGGASSDLLFSIPELEIGNQTTTFEATSTTRGHRRSPRTALRRARIRSTIQRSGCTKEPMSPATKLALEAVGAVEPSHGKWLGDLGIRDAWLVVFQFLELGPMSWAFECVNSDFELMWDCKWHEALEKALLDPTLSAKERKQYQSRDSVTQSLDIEVILEETTFNVDCVSLKSLGGRALNRSILAELRKRIAQRYREIGHGLAAVHPDPCPETEIWMLPEHEQICPSIVYNDWNTLSRRQIFDWASDPTHSWAYCWVTICGLDPADAKRLQLNPPKIRVDGLFHPHLGGGLNPPIWAPATPALLYHERFPENERGVLFAFPLVALVRQSLSKPDFWEHVAYSSCLYTESLFQDANGDPEKIAAALCYTRPVEEWVDGIFYENWKGLRVMHWCPLIGLNLVLDPIPGYTHTKVSNGQFITYMNRFALDQTMYDFVLFNIASRCRIANLLPEIRFKCVKDNLPSPQVGTS